MIEGRITCTCLWEITMIVLTEKRRASHCVWMTLCLKYHSPVVRFSVLPHFPRLFLVHLIQTMRQAALMPSRFLFSKDAAVIATAHTALHYARRLAFESIICNQDFIYGAERWLNGKSLASLPVEWFGPQHQCQVANNH